MAGLSRWSNNSHRRHDDPDPRQGREPYVSGRQPFAIAPMTDEHADAVLAIYQAGIEEAQRNPATPGRS
jgi:hypothetical protein